MKYKCIVIDDDFVISNAVKVLCKSINEIECLATFNSPINGLKYIDKNNIDLIFLDVVLPMTSGYEFLTKLPNSVRVIMMSGFNLQGKVTPNVVDFLRKPLEQKRFETAVKRFLDEKDKSTLLNN
jgi:two-component SAPR family response regulator